MKYNGKIANVKTKKRFNRKTHLMPENNNQRTTHIGGNASEAIILAGDGNLICGKSGIGKSVLSAFLIRKFQKDKIENIVSDFAKEGYSKHFLKDREDDLRKCSVNKED